MQNEHMKKQGYEMEYVKIEDSGKRSFGQKKKSYNYICNWWQGISVSGKGKGCLYHGRLNIY